MAAHRSVVITGASTGIGRACALHMDRLGWKVFAGVRKQSDADSLRLEASAQLTPLLLDVTEALAIEKAEQVVRTSVGSSGLAGLVNNAGIAHGGPVELLALEEMRRLFETNFFGAIAVTQTLIPLLRLGRGRIVNMSSISGMVASPFLSPYTTSKWALEALSDAMRVELHPWDIKVSVVQPGAINTPIWSKGLQTAHAMMKGAPADSMELYAAAVGAIEAGLQPHGIAPEQVARVVAHALTSRRPRTRYAVGKDAAIVSLFRRLPDRVRDAFFLSRLRKGQ